MALTLFEDFVYWTDGKSKSLRRAHKTTGTQGMELLNSWQAIKSIKVYHSLRQPEGTRSIWCSGPVRPPRAERCSQASDGLLTRKWFCVIQLELSRVFRPSVQCPSTSVKLQMEDAATCVSCLLVGITDVPVPLISTWPLIIKPASPTAPPVRWAAFLHLLTSERSLSHVVSVLFWSVFPLKANSFTPLRVLLLISEVAEEMFVYRLIQLWKLQLKQRVEIYSCFLFFSSPIICCGVNSFAVGQMSASPSGGSVTLWTTVGTDQTNPLTAVSDTFF